MRLDQILPKAGIRLLAGVSIVLSAPAHRAGAFPLVDVANQSSLLTGGPAPGSSLTSAPRGTELPEADAKGLGKQLRLTTPGAAGNPSAWTITPRISIQEQLTDNAFQVTRPRKFDARTVVSPGLSILADTARLKLNFDYQPNLIIHAVNGNLNALTHQLNATGTITVLPNLAFIDVRGVTGVQSRLGSLAGGGTLGSAGSGAITGGFGAIGQGLNRQNEVQTSSFGIAPYMLRKFGEYGTAKIGVSGDYSRSSSVTGFLASPFPTGSGGDVQNLLTTEQIASFTTGEVLGKIQNSLTVNASQSRTDSRSAAGGPSSFTSERTLINNQVSYAISRNFTILGSIGHQSIRYSGGFAPPINGLTWSGGVTITPGPDSTITVTYGRQNGANAFNANGHFALTGRTLLSVDYSNTIGTQLEYLQNQLNATTINVNGQAVNSLTGGPQFGATNALGVQNGVFRFETFNASLATAFQRDTIQVTATWSTQTSVGRISSASEVKTATVAWTHELRPDLSFNANASYSIIQRSGSTGNDTSFATAAGLQYLVSESTTLTGRYSFFNRSSRIPGYGLYENVLLLGMTKKF